MPAKVIAGDIGKLEPNEFKTALQEAGIDTIDTAARYGNGESEKKIGQSKLSEIFTIDTKVLITGNGDDTLTPEAIEKSVTNSLSVLGLDKVHVLYCHAPDMKTPVEDQARGFNEQYKKGRFVRLGVSNFPVPMIEEWLEIAERNNYVKPSVYQGQYNLVSRGYETLLFPLLRKHNMLFRAFSPLAGGFLLGNFTADGVQGGSRFSMNSPFTTWYDQPSMHEAIKKLKGISEKSGLGMDELSLRWLVHHSILNDDDAIIIGGSKPHMFGKNMAQIKKGPLDDAVVKELNALGELVKDAGMSLVDHGNYFMGTKRSG